MRVQTAIDELKRMRTIVIEVSDLDLMPDSPELTFLFDIQAAWGRYEKAVQE